MSHSYAEIREYRVTQPGPWFRVEGSGNWLTFLDGAEVECWTPIARFLTRVEAEAYVADVQKRQSQLLAWA